MDEEIRQNDNIIFLKYIQLCRFMKKCFPKHHQQSIVLHQCRAFGIKCYAYQNIETLLFRVSNAIVNLLLTENHGLQLATIFLKQFCRPKDYWDILHQLDKIQDYLKKNILKSQQVLEIIPIKKLKIHPYNLTNKFECFCNGENIQKYDRCFKCLSIFHPYCQKQSNICVKCYLQDSSLNNRAILNLFCGYLKADHRMTLIEFKAPDVDTARTTNTLYNSYLVELRIQKSGNNTTTEKITKHFNFYLNDQILNFRSDESEIRLPLRFLKEDNLLIIQTKHFNLDRVRNLEYIVGIYKVVPKILKNISNSLVRMPQNNTYSFYSSIQPFKKFKIVSLLSPKTKKHMTLPVRSYKCKHFECFDIGDLCEKNVITFLNRKRGKPKSQSKNEKEKVCPLCGIKIQCLYIDPIFEKYLEMKNKKGKRIEQIVMSFNDSKEILQIQELDVLN